MNLGKKDSSTASNPFGRQDDEAYFFKGDKNNATSTTLAYTGELKNDDGFQDYGKPKNKLSPFVQEFPGEESSKDQFQVRHTHQPKTQGSLTTKIQAFGSASKTQKFDENDDAWGGFNLFAKEKEKKPTGNFADKFASKLQQEKQTFKVDLFKEEQKKEKQDHRELVEIYSLLP